ncbi:hypothetical protein DITRI_Ditri15bG0037200 [Diplodiscus trichospermus]
MSRSDAFLTSYLLRSRIYVLCSSGGDDIVAGCHFVHFVKECNEVADKRAKAGVHRNNDSFLVYMLYQF